MPVVYKYWCEPASKDDLERLLSQIRTAADYRRELARIENRLRLLLRAYRDRTSEADLAEKKPIRELCNLARIAARARAVSQGLHWGTYQAVEEAADHSAKTTAFYDDVDTFVPRDAGSVCVHLQPARQLKGTDDRWIRVGDRLVRHASPYGKGSAEVRRNGQPRPAKYVEVALRVGTDSAGEPTWATVHALLHRPLPDAAVISWARIKAIKIATKTRWEVQFTVNSSADQSAVIGPVAHGSSADRSQRSDTQRAGRSDLMMRAVGVNTGWRKMPDDNSIRVATWWGTDGRHGYLTLPERVWGRDGKSDSLRAIRDRAKNELVAELVAFRRQIADSSAPESESGDGAVRLWLERTQTLHAWQRGGRFVGLLSWWRDHRFAGDDDMLARLTAWQKQDRHLWEWEANNRMKRQRAIDDAIRKLAAQLAREYGRIGVEAPFVDKLKRETVRCDACKDLPKRCDACREAARLRDLNNQRIMQVTPASVRQALELAGKKYGATPIRISPLYITQTCSTCELVRADADFEPIDVGCPRCGVVEDQDITAAKNLARHASAAVPDEDGRPLASEIVKTSVRKPRQRGTRKRVKDGVLETVPRSG